MAQLYLPPDQDVEAPFWPRFAKGAVLILLGAAAHQWLLPQQGAPVVQVVQTGAPRPFDGVAAPLSRREAAIAASQETSDGPLMSIPTEASATPAEASAPPAENSLRIRPVGSSGVSAREPLSRPASISRSTPAAAVVSDSPLEEKMLTPLPAPGEVDTDTGLDAATDALPSGESVRDESPALVAATAPIHSPVLTLAGLPMAGGGDSLSITDVPEAFAERETPVTREDNSEERVRRILQEYRQAYESLDVAAARTIWPSVDHVALTHAFRQLTSQRLTFESCGISVSGASALARCQGRAEYIPKVGAQRALRARGEWVFDLARADSDWKIVSASVH